MRQWLGNRLSGSTKPHFFVCLQLFVYFLSVITNLGISHKLGKNFFPQAEIKFGRFFVDIPIRNKTKNQ